MNEKEELSDNDIADEKEAPKESSRSINGAFPFKWFVLIVLAVAAMVYITRPAIYKSEKMMEMTQAVSNSKQIY